MQVLYMTVQLKLIMNQKRNWASQNLLLPHHSLPLRNTHPFAHRLPVRSCMLDYTLHNLISMDHVTLARCSTGLAVKCQ